MSEKQEGKEESCNCKSSGCGCGGGGCGCGKVLLLIFLFFVGGCIGYLFGRMPCKSGMKGGHMGMMGGMPCPMMADEAPAQPQKK